MNKNSMFKNASEGILRSLETIDHPMENQSSLDESKRVNTEKSKSVKVEKSKRSFMLTQDGIRKLYLLKAKNPSKDLSEIVEEAINLVFDKLD